MKKLLNINNIILCILVCILISLTSILTYIYIFNGSRLYYSFEGYYVDWNFRDVGQSINSCQISMFNNVLYPSNHDLIFRSNKFFSSHSCKKIGNVDRIYSLNFTPKKALTEYFCKKEDNSLLIGYHMNVDFTLDNIEILNNWDDTNFSSPLCTTFYSIFMDLQNNKKILIHCNAGRDRTGAVVAILMAALFESTYGQLNADFIDILECDYRKTKRLNAKKYNTIKNMLNEILNTYNSVNRFLHQKCLISPQIITNAAQKIFNNLYKK